jgi:hypothetical protein
MLTPSLYYRLCVSEVRDLQENAISVRLLVITAFTYAADIVKLF